MTSKGQGAPGGVDVPQVHSEHRHVRVRVGIAAGTETSGGQDVAVLHHKIPIPTAIKAQVLRLKKNYRRGGGVKRGRVGPL